MSGGDGTPELAPVGIIGGGGVLSPSWIEDARSVRVDAAFGTPSAPPLVGRLGGVRVAFIARNGEGHSLLPSEVNHRANLEVLKVLGVRQVLAFDAVGSLREEVAIGHFVVADQFVDLSSGRSDTFFGGGVAGYVSMARPTCGERGEVLRECLERAGGTVHSGGYLMVDGPHFSGMIESRLRRDSGCAVIGMACATEAKLAREAGMCYNAIAAAGDYDSWHASQAEARAEDILGVLAEASGRADRAAAAAVAPLGALAGCSGECRTATRRAIATAKPHRDPAAVARLRNVLGDDALGGEGW